MKQTSQYLVFACVVSVLTFLSFWFAAAPVSLSDTSKYIADRPEGKLVFEAFDALKKRDLTALEQDHYDPSKLKISIEQLHAIEIQLESYIDDKKLTFVDFTGYETKTTGDKTDSDITFWFKSEAQAQLYVNVEVKFSGIGDRLNLVYWHVTSVNGKLNFSDPFNVLTFSQIWKLSLIKIASIFLALFCICLSGIAFAKCIINWDDGESKYWAIPVLFGVIPIKVGLWGPAVSWKIATVLFPAGWLTTSMFEFGFFIANDGQKSTDVSGQFALFSFPIALLYFVRRYYRASKNGADFGADNATRN